MAIANIVSHLDEPSGFFVTAKLPSGELINFHARGQADAISIMQGLTTVRQKADPVIDGLVELNPSPPDPPPPTQAELDQAKWFSDYAGERTHQVLATLSPALKAAYKPEYGAL